MSTNLLNPTDYINHFVYLSKCLPGLNGAIPDDSSAEEHQGIIALRKRIVAAMNYYLDALRLPKNDTATKPTLKDHESDAEFVLDVISVYMTEMRALNDKLLKQVGGTELTLTATNRLVAQIKTNFDASIQKFGAELRAKYLSTDK